MFLKIRNRLEKELADYICELDKSYSLNRISPLLFKSIKEFISRKGKRIRPSLFVIGYLGYAKKAAFNLYRTAISLELLHDFMLVHDDIIDKSAVRRGKPSMHEALNGFLRQRKGLKFTGEDLAIVIGDIMFAMAINSFLSVKEKAQHKENALRKLTEAAFYTGGGEFFELICGLKTIEKIARKDIYKIYDLKTAKYTFSYPLTIGATLAGAKDTEINKLSEYGIKLGRAFQIKDDILGMFGSEVKIGKSVLTDLQEAKKTILIWYAYNHSTGDDRLAVKKIFSKGSVTNRDLFKMRRIVSNSGALEYAKNEVNSLIAEAKALGVSLKMRKPYKEALRDYSEKLLSL